MIKFGNIDGLSLMIEDSSKVEIETYPDGAIMLYCHLHANEAPISIGVSEAKWAELKAKYPKILADKGLIHD